MSTSRLEAFSDGVFAIAITLLVLTIAQPGDYRRLGHSLAGQWPALAAYVVSFAVIGIMWLNHHTLVSHVRQVDRRLILYNLVLLMTIGFLPYPTGVFGEALARGQGTRTAAVFYSATMFVNACAWAGLWLHASGARRLLVPSFPEEQRRKVTVLFCLGVVVYAGSAGVALVNAGACLAFHGVLAVYYALDPLAPGSGRRRRRTGAAETPYPAGTDSGSPPAQGARP
ncbi:MAG: TMEM175 family protein [Acidimicrobiales bacterium]